MAAVTSFFYVQTRVQTMRLNSWTFQAAFLKIHDIRSTAMHCQTGLRFNFLVLRSTDKRDTSQVVYLKEKSLEMG